MAEEKEEESLRKVKEGYSHVAMSLKVTLGNFFRNYMGVCQSLAQYHLLRV